MKIYHTPSFDSNSFEKTNATFCINQVFLIGSFILLVQGFLFNSPIVAQNISFNKSGAAPHSSAMLDVNDTASGILIPRLSAQQRNQIVNPETSLLVYQVDSPAGFYYYDGSLWQLLGASGSGYGIADVLATGNEANAQSMLNLGAMSIGDTVANGSSLLSLESVSKGFLPPRMTTAQIQAISNPEAGLRVYNLDVHCPYFFNGTSWKPSCNNSNANSFFANSASNTSISYSSFLSNSSLAGYSYGTSVKVDQSNYCYLAGEFYDSLILDTITLIYNGNYSGLFLAKVNPSGQVTWAISADDCRPYDIAIDQWGNCYITGQVYESTVFMGASINQGGGTHFFLAKISSSGDLKWVKTATSDGGEYSSGVEVDSLDNVYVAMDFNTVNQPLNWAGVSFSSTHNDGNNDELIMKLDSSGAVLWHRQLGGNSSNILAYDLKFHSTGLFLCGYYNGGIDFTGNLDTLNLIYSYIDGGYYSDDSYVVKFTAQGNFEWTTLVTNLNSGWSEIIAMDLDDQGNIYLTGASNGYQSYGNNFTNDSLAVSEYFIAKLNSLGGFQWVKNAQTDYYCWLEDIKVDDNNTIYASGYFSTAIDVDSNTYYSVGDPDLVLIKLDQNGVVGWFETAGDVFAYINEIDCTTDHKIVATGSIQGTVVLSNDTLLAPNNDNLFIWIRDPQ